MKVSEQWLREWVNPPIDTHALIEQLTMAGLEVDGVEAAAPALDKVVVGQVVKINPHPDADRLQVCDVDIGAGESLQIVCGAANVQEQGKYPVATVGAELPNGLTIKRSKLRGVESLGMLCSSKELGLADDASGLLELDSDFERGQPIAIALGLHDQIIDLDLTPNRADCFSVLGVSRDLAAVNDIGFTEPNISPVPASCDDALQIKLDANDGCAVFAGRIIRNIDPQAATPFWMVEKLRRSGIRALHPVVDVTNYVMLELGQPMHAYDLSKLKGNFSARWAASGEQLKLLDEKTLTLSDDVMVIANADEPVALAGIMGGASTAVSRNTADIFLESAWFAPSAMAGKARRFGMHTDASLRFERGVDFTGQVRAIERATELLLEIVGGSPGPTVESRDEDALPVRTSVELRQSRLETVLGLPFLKPDVSRMFSRLGMDCVENESGWSVTPTSARFDIAIEADLIEEVARLHGYDRIPAAPQHTAARLQSSSERNVDLQRACDLLIDRGYHEVITYSFVDPDRQQELLGERADLIDLMIANPLSQDLSAMRRSLWVGLLDTLSLNANRQQSRVRIFETGLRFTFEDNDFKEEKVIAGAMWGALAPENWRSTKDPADLFDIKSDITSLLALTGKADAIRFVAAEHPALCPGRCAQLLKGDLVVGWLGELHPRLQKTWNLQPAPVLFELLSEPVLEANVPNYLPISRFPSVRRDLAVIVSEDIPAGDLVAATQAVAGELLRDIMVFDVFTGQGIENGLKSVALGLILQETSRTLTELEIEGLVDSVKSQLSSQYNASIRE